MDESLVTKHLEKVEIPENLLKDILYVNYLIVKKDESAVKETDDCIQTDYLCGGLWNKKNSQYGFTYYPEKSSSDNSWDFEITKKQIIDIANVKITHLNLWKCDNPKCNHYHSHENTRCTFCNPIDTTVNPKYSREEVENLQNNKRELLEKWKTKLK